MKNRLFFFILILLFTVSLLQGKTSQSVETRFQYKAPVGTKSVFLAGDFNDWSSTETALTDADGDGVWETVLDLEYGKYEYRFVVDSAKWMRDPLNPDYGGMNSNSIIFVRNPLEPVLKDIWPATGEILYVNNFTISVRFIPGAHQVEADVKATKILFDGKPSVVSYDESTKRIFAQVRYCLDGEHKIKVRVIDKNGFTARPVEVFVLVNTQNEPPRAHAGYTQIVTSQNKMHLNGGLSDDTDLEPITKYSWELISNPAESNAKFDKINSPFPEFTPDEPGEYKFTLKVKTDDIESAPDTVDVHAVKRGRYPTHFTFDSREFTTSVTSVDLVGEFNRWQPDQASLQDYNNDGIWEVWVDLPQGKYEYKFVLNKNDWVPDPENPQQVADGWNGVNSVKDVTFSLAPIPNVNSLFIPGKMVLDATTSQSKLYESLQFQWFQERQNPFQFEMATEQKISFPVPKCCGVYTFYLVTKDKYGASPTKTVDLFVEPKSYHLKDFSASPDWGDDAIIYEIYVRKFTPEGTLNGVIEKLDYLRTLGVNCIWLMPIWESPLEHGYAPTDFFKVDPEYGTNEDLARLVNAAHTRGIKVMLDFIANHSSDQHRYFKAAFQNPNSVFRNWYHWRSPDLSSNGLNFEYHNDWDQLPNLNYENPLVWNFMIEVGKFWLKYDIDGYRCDVAWGVPHNFWKTFRREIKKINPDCILLNEVLPRSPEYHDDEFDMSYDTDFYGNLLDVFNQKKPVSALNFGIQKAMINYPESAQSLRYIENHDMERFIASFDQAKTRLAAMLLFTIPGTPLLYYGQEIGMVEQRTAMLWPDEPGELYHFYRQLLKIRRQNKAFRSHTLQEIPTDQKKIFAFLRQDEMSEFLVVLNFSDKPVSCDLDLRRTKLAKNAATIQCVNLMAPKEEVLTTPVENFNLTLKSLEGLIFQLRGE